MKPFRNFKSLVLLCLCIVLTAGVQAQATDTPRQSKRERIEQLKIAFISQELNLASAEAEKFWPIYNEMSNLLKKEKRQRKEKSNQLKRNYGSLSENEVRKKVVEILDSEIYQAQLRKEYTEKIAAVVGYKKAVKLLTVERRFKQDLLKKVNQNQNRQQGQQRQRGQGGRNN